MYVCVESQEKGGKKYLSNHGQLFSNLVKSINVTHTKHINQEKTSRQGTLINSQKNSHEEKLLNAARESGHTTY